MTDSDTIRWLDRLHWLERFYDGPIPAPLRRWVYAGDPPAAAPLVVVWHRRSVDAAPGPST